MSGFDTSPKPYFLLSIQHDKWTVAGALSELVDNGFGPGRGDAQRIVITHDTTKRTITILDNGRGMEALGRLFQLGNTIGRTAGDIGMYGSGGTRAIIWLPHLVEVWTLRGGLVSHHAVDWPKQFTKDSFPIVSNDWKRSNILNTPVELISVKHGTFIKMHLLKERAFHKSNVIRDLGETYAPAIRQNKKLIWRTAGKESIEQVLSDPMPPLASAVRIDLLVDVPDADTPLPVTGEIGIVEGLPTSRSMVSVSYGIRVMFKTRDCYSSLDGTEKFLGTGVTGWIDLGDGWQPYLTSTKNAINDPRASDALMGCIFKEIRPLLQKTDVDELNLVLDGIAIELAEMLNGRAEIEVRRSAKTIIDPLGDEKSGRREGDKPDNEQEPNSPAQKDLTDQTGEDATKPEPAAARIGIEKSTDEEMEGALCRAYTLVGDRELLVAVNRDHYVVQQSLRAKPINRIALNLMVANAIADVVVHNMALQKRMFSRRVLREIDIRQETDRPAYVTRLLIDRMRNLDLAEAA